MNPLDDEEQRKRREAAAMADEATASGGGYVDPSFMDVAKQYLTNRFDQASNNLSQAGNALMNPQQALQQRMMNDQNQQRQEDQANTQVQTNTTTTYGDGSQERTVKTQVPAGQAQQQPQQPQPQQQAPLGAMMGPVSPNSPEAQQQAEQFAQAMAKYQQPQQAQARSVAQPQQQPQQQPQTPNTAVNPANYSLGTGQPQQGLRMPPMAGQVAAAPGASLAQMGAQAQAQPKPWVQAANDAGTDFYKLLDVANKHPESKDMIYEKLKSSFKQQNMKDDAESIMKAAQEGDLKAMNKIQQAIRPDTGKAREEITVSDYLKAYMYNRLGLTALSQDIQNKIIGKETKFGQVTVNGSNWQVETDPSGNIIRAKDDEGNFATETTLNKLRANSVKSGSQAFGFTGESATIPTGQTDAGQEYRQRTNSISGAIENVITTGPNAGKIYGGPPGAAKSVGTSYSKALNQAYIDFQTKPTIEMAKKMMEIAGQVDDGSGRTTNAVMNQIRQMNPGIFNQITSGAAGTPPAPTGVGGNTNMGGAATNENVARIQRDIVSIQNEMARKPTGDPQREQQRQAILQKELSDRQAWLSQNGGGNATAAPAQGGGGRAMGGGSLASQLTTQNKIAGEVGEDLGKIKVNQPKAEQNADYLLTKVNELVAHPGFETSVGRKGISYGFGMTKEPIFEGTDASDWQARFKEVQGQSFLQGIENLRGMGALSNQEGEAATKAIQRMSTSQSEKEFRAAAQDFNEIIQRGVDRNRVKLGQPPLYGTKPASETAKQPENKPAKLSAQDKQAVEWARQNPNDPRSAQIKQRLGL